MSAILEGILGAVMGGAKSAEDYLKEEQEAKRKEEEDKRRAELQFSIEERKAATAEARKKANEEEAAKKVAGYMAPRQEAVLSQSPEEPGGVISEQMQMKGGTLKEALDRAITAGDMPIVKKLSEELTAQIERETKASRESREKAKADREAAKGPEETSQMKFYADLFKRAYPGEKDEKGEPVDKAAFEKYQQGQFAELAGRRTYIRQPGEGGPKETTVSPRVFLDAQNTANKNITEEFTSTVRGKKEFDSFAASRAKDLAAKRLTTALEEDPTKINALDIARNAANEVREAQRKAKTQAEAEWEKLDAKTKAGTTKTKYVREGQNKYLDDFLSGAPAPQVGAPWARNWGQ